MPSIMFTSIEAMRGRRLSNHNEALIPHPARSLLSAYQNLKNDIASFAASYDRIEDITHGDAGQRFRDICYRAAEIFELYSQLKDCFIQKSKAKDNLIRKDYSSIAKENGYHWKLLCNRMKHNGDRLFPVTVRYKNNEQFGRGYSLRRFVNHSWEVNTDHHINDSHYFSYARALRFLVFNLDQTDRASANLIQSASDSPIAEILVVPDKTPAMFESSQIDQIFLMPLVLLPNEADLTPDLNFADKSHEWLILAVAYEEGEFWVFESHYGDGMPQRVQLPLQGWSR